MLFSLKFVRYFCLFAFYEQLNFPNIDNKIVQDALNAFTARTGIKADWKGAPAKGKKAGLDGYVRFKIAGKVIEMPAEIKTTVRAAHLPQLNEKKQELGTLLVLAASIPPGQQEQLKDLGIFFIDSAGNVHIWQDNFIILFKGEKPGPRNTNDARTFSKGGLKVIFQLLLDDNLVNATIREIAFRTQVSLDTVHKTINGLKTMQYLLPLNKNELTWHNKQELLTTWMKEYDRRLKPGLFIRRFDFLHDKDFDRWKQLRFKDELTCWSGEPGGELLTNNLKPAELTLYTMETEMQLIRNYRMIPKKAGAIVVYKRFWPARTKEPRFAPPLLVYADLVNTGERRNIENAQKIFNEYLQDKFQTT